LQAQIEILDAEINDVAASRSEELAQARIKLDEASRAFESRNRDVEGKVQRYQDEIARRRHLYHEELAAVEAEGDQQKTQLENSVKSVTEKNEKIKQLITGLQEQGKAESRAIQEELSDLREAIDAAKVREEQQVHEAREQMAALRSAQHDTMGLEQQVLSLREEIAQMKRENQELRRECGRVDALQYTARISKFRSHLH
jgi:chromosome segregation ATPase